MPQPSASRGAIAATLRDRSDALFDLESLPQLIEVDVAAVAPNPAQPRQAVDPVALEELAQSIEQHGLLQPIVVSAAPGGRYVLVAGQRRLLAFRQLGRERIAALLTTGRADELALIENLQREDLTPLDEAEALARLQRHYGYTQDQLARTMAKAKSTISELLSLNDLPEPIKTEVRTSELPISKSLLIEIARLGDPAAQLHLWAQVRGGGTVRAARAARAAPALGTAGGRPAVPERQRLLRSAQRLGAQLDALDPAAATADDELRASLRRLQERLAVVLDAGA